MIWDLPLYVRLSIIFILLPLFDNIYNFFFGYYLTSSNVIHNLQKFNKIWYMFSWFLITKIIIVTIFIFILEFLSNFAYISEYDYNFFIRIMSIFSIGYFSSNIYSLYPSTISKYISVIIMFITFITNIWYTQKLFLIFGSLYFSDPYKYELLLAICIIYRFKLESLFRL